MLDDVTTFRTVLLDWYRQHQRDLPWRRNPTPYEVLLSETMLQQTQVATVIPYYFRFLSRFPDLASLAGAAEDEVLTYWSGLGYYRRARQLLKVAHTIQNKAAGNFPTTREALEELPGIGPYTARAVASIAFNEPVAVVDGNVKRVLSRLCLFDEEISSSRALAKLQSLADQLLDKNHPGDFNQAVMELGATICTPQQPKCVVCPVQRFCRAYVAQRQHALPLIKKKNAGQTFVGVGCLIMNQHREVMLIKNPPAPLGKSGLWEIPVYWNASLEKADQLLQQQFTITPQLQRPLRRLQHAITDNRLKIDLGLFELRGRGINTDDKIAWLPLTSQTNVVNIPISGLTKKALRLLETI